MPKLHYLFTQILGFFKFSLSPKPFRFLFPEKIMEKPSIPSMPSQIQPKDKPNNNSTTPTGQNRKKLPTAKDLISHYESQGLETQEASVKVIDDLQTMLFKVISSSRGKKTKDKFMAETSRKLDNANTRLALLEMKVDSKPGFGETLVIGVAAGTVLKGMENTLPHVVGAIGQIWNAVRSSTK